MEKEPERARQHADAGSPGRPSSASSQRPDHQDPEPSGRLRSGPPGGYTRARLVGLILGPTLFLLTMLFLRPEGLSSEGVAVLASTLWIGTWWVTEAIPIPATSLLPLILLPLTNAVPGDDVASSYGDDIVFLFLGGFALAIAMELSLIHI